jgi:hypothetical protein
MAWTGQPAAAEIERMTAMEPTQTVLLDALDRVRSGVHRVLDGLSEGDLTIRPGGRGNHIGWLIWHLTRVQDDHMADAFDSQQVWTSADWFEKFALPFAPEETGYGQSSVDVDAVRVGSLDLLTGYYDAVHAQSVEYISGLRAADLDRIVDEAWDPPVTLGVRLVSVIADDLQHVGQAAYAKGLL